MSNIQGNINSILGNVEGAVTKGYLANTAKNINEESKTHKVELRDRYASDRADYLKNADFARQSIIKNILGDQFEEWKNGGYVKLSQLSPVARLQYKNMMTAINANKPCNSTDFDAGVAPIRSKLDENSVKAFDSMLEKRVGINNREQFFEHRKEQIMNAPKREIPGLSEEDLRNLDNLGI